MSLSCLVLYSSAPVVDLGPEKKKPDVDEIETLDTSTGNKEDDEKVYTDSSAFLKVKSMSIKKLLPSILEVRNKRQFALLPSIHV